MDRFFGYQFSTYGTDVLRISELPIEERVDPMSKVFPKVRAISITSFLSTHRMFTQSLPLLILCIY